MPQDLNNQLSRRERQIMDILFEKSEATAQEVRHAIPNPPSYSTIRALLARLKEKGVIDHKQDGARYVYFTKIGQAAASTSALKRLVRVFFKGSVSQAAASLLDIHANDISEEELDQLARLIEKRKKEMK